MHTLKIQVRINDSLKRSKSFENTPLQQKYFGMSAKSLQLYLTLATSWTITSQAPLSMRFPSQEYWSGLPFPPPEDIPDLGIEPISLTLQGILCCCAPGKPGGLLTGALNSADGCEIILKPGVLEKLNILNVETQSPDLFSHLTPRLSPQARFCKSLP